MSLALPPGLLVATADVHHSFPIRRPDATGFLALLGLTGLLGGGLVGGHGPAALVATGLGRLVGDGVLESMLADFRQLRLLFRDVFEGVVFDLLLQLPIGLEPVLPVGPRRLSPSLPILVGPDGDLLGGRDGPARWAGGG